MSVFAAKFLEPPSAAPTLSVEDWAWSPYRKDIGELYASGAKTATRSSTYAAEKDDNSDSDRPNEGL